MGAGGALCPPRKASWWFLIVSSVIRHPIKSLNVFYEGHKVTGRLYITELKLLQAHADEPQINPISVALHSTTFYVKHVTAAANDVNVNNKGGCTIKWQKHGGVANAWVLAKIVAGWMLELDLWMPGIRAEVGS